MLAAQSAAFRSELKRTDVDLEQVRAVLPSDSALVSIVRFTRTVFDQPKITSVPSYVAFVLRSGNEEPSMVSLGRADTLDALTAQWRREVITSIAQSSVGASETERSFRIRGASLRRRCGDPIASQLDGVRRVFVVPDGAINLIPLAALPVAGSGYLLEQGPVIHYVSAERDLVPGERPLAESGRGLLAVGGPAFADGSVFASLSQTKPANSARVQARAEMASPAGSDDSGLIRRAGSKCP